MKTGAKWLIGLGGAALALFGLSKLVNRETTTTSGGGGAVPPPTPVPGPGGTPNPKQAWLPPNGRLYVIGDENAQRLGEQLQLYLTGYTDPQYVVTDAHDEADFGNTNLAYATTMSPTKGDTAIVVLGNHDPSPSVALFSAKSLDENLRHNFARVIYVWPFSKERRKVMADVFGALTVKSTLWAVEDMENIDMADDIHPDNNGITQIALRLTDALKADRTA